MSETYTAVLDRFEEDQAILLLERDDELVDELVLPESVLPAAGRHQDAIFTLIKNEERTELTYESEETDERKTRAQSRFDRLSQSLSSQE
jgi:hypothetical protein